MDAMRKIQTAIMNARAAGLSRDIGVAVKAGKFIVTRTQGRKTTILTAEMPLEDVVARIASMAV